MARQMVYGNDDNAYIDHSGMVHETQKGSSDEGGDTFRHQGRKGVDTKEAHQRP